MFVRMANTNPITTLRRSPRFLTPTPITPQEQRRSLRFLQSNQISPPTLPELRRSLPPIRQVRSSHASLRSTGNVSPKTPKSIHVHTPKNLSKKKNSNRVLIMENRVDDIQTPRRSSRLLLYELEGKNVKVALNTLKKPSKTNAADSSRKKDSYTGLENSLAFGNGIEGMQTPRRSSRLSYASMIDDAVEGKNVKLSKSSMTLNTPKKLSKPSDVSSKKKDLNTGSDSSSLLINEVEGMQTPRRSARLSYASRIDNALEGKNVKLSKTSMTLKASKKPCKPSDVSSKKKYLNTGSENYSLFKNEVEGIQTPRRSYRLSYASMMDNALEGKNAKVSKISMTLNTPKKPSKPNAVSSKKKDSCTRSNNFSPLKNGVEGVQTPRRSSRLSYEPMFENVLEGKNKKLSKISMTLNTPKKPSKPNAVSSIKKDSHTRFENSSTFENGVEGIQTPRRSSRLSYVPMVDNVLEGKNVKLSKSSISVKRPSPKVIESPRLDNGNEGLQSIGKSNRSSNKKTGPLHVHNVVMKKSSEGENVVERERRKGNPADHEGTATKDDGGMEKKSVANRKRKRENNVVANTKGWTKEQEAALQRAYYAAKPTPQFWKKVSKLVSGKSAQDCFDKVHLDHLTPPQPRPRSRAKSKMSSQIELMSLSDGKLLNLDGAVSRKHSRRKSRNTQKTVRYLLEKNFQGVLNCEADLFSQLEPNINLSNHTPPPRKQVSITKDLQGNQALERSLSNHKKPLSRFSSPVEIVVSPPVLKQVKNKALHEKYIDQLHSREARRKSLSKCKQNCFVGLKDVHAARTNDLRAAKNALISDARDAIHQLQHLQANAMNNDPDFDDNGDSYDDVGSENEDEI